MFTPPVNKIDGACKHFVENGSMHESTRRLYAAVSSMTGGKVSELGDVADYVGVSTQVLKNWEYRGVSKDGRLSIYEKRGIDPNWLSTGEGPMLPGEPSGLPSLANTSPGPDIRGRVPLISWVQAGEWCNAADPHPPGQADRWMDCPVSHSSSTFALRVRGDSMTAPHGNSRTYPEGCFIFVDPEKRTPDNGERVVACLTGTDEVTFKIYKNEDGRQWLQPLNPSHEPIRENFHILGTVLGKWEDG